MGENIALASGTVGPGLQFPSGDTCQGFEKIGLNSSKFNWLLIKYMYK